MAKYVSIGSTQKRKFHGVVRADSLGGELLGKLGFLRYLIPSKEENSSEITVLCQVTSVDRRNTVHEDVSFGPVIAAKGNIPYLSGTGDYEQAVLKPLAQQINGKPGALRANPPSGTDLVSLDDEVVRAEADMTPQDVFNSFSPHDPKYMRYIGRLVGEGINLPIIMKNFDPGDTTEDSWSEGRHVMFLGRQGSGKTHLAKMMLGLYLSSNPTIGALIPDGKGDFVSPGRADLNLKAFLEANGRSIKVIQIDDIKLEDSAHFRELVNIANLKKLIFNGNNEKWDEIIDGALDRFSNESSKLIISDDGAISYDGFILALNNLVRHSYSGSENAIQKRVDVLVDKQTNSRRRAEAVFNGVLQRFNQGIPIADIVEGVLGNGEIYFLDIGSWDDQVNVFILGDLYRKIRSRSSQRFKMKKNSNSIIYVDEANRFIPQTPDERNKHVQRELIDGIKTTRQYGVGWWFADQRPSSVSKDAFSQMGTYFFGRGMNVSADRENMKSIIGDEGVEIYEYVMNTGGKAFIAFGQLIGIGNSESVSIPIESYATWEVAVEEMNSLNLQLKAPMP